VQVLHNLHSVLGQKLGVQHDRFCTVVYGNLTKRNTDLMSSLPRRPPAPIAARADFSANYVDSVGGHAVGLIAAPHFVASRFHLAPGDTLVLYTDGLTEALTGVRRERLRR